MMAESLEFVCDEIDKITKGDAAKLNEACQKVIQGIMKKHGRIVFNGDGYADAWQKEAEKRGLPNLKTAADALPTITDADVVKMFEKYEVLSKEELYSRAEIYHEQYNQHIQTEAELVVKIAKTIILPAAIRYQGELAGTAASMKAVGIEPTLGTLEEITTKLRDLQKATAALEKLNSKDNFKSVEEEAVYKTSKILPAMLVVREVVDFLESVVADDLWPLPSYQEMLFIK